jgi:hypothetical protein
MAVATVCRKSARVTITNEGKHTIQGTGSEDYFCESYGLRPGCFPWFGVSLLEEPFTCAYRWHVPDPVSFRKSLRFFIEHGNGVAPFRSNNFYYSVASWYQTEHHAPFPKLSSPSERSAWSTTAKPTGTQPDDRLSRLHTSFHLSVTASPFDCDRVLRCSRAGRLALDSNRTWHAAGLTPGGVILWS